jgi:hypothetical protein
LKSAILANFWVEKQGNNNLTDSLRYSKVENNNVERAICDIIRSEKKIETEIFVSALQGYAKSKSKKLNLLLEYASAFGISYKVEEKLKVLL